ncbi:MAG: hypothetical protein ACXADB_07730 [Candidatus Hermodarchaeia archaeon]|jgi:putative DNA primase/helicase
MTQLLFSEDGSSSFFLKSSRRENTDLQILDKLTTDEELSGLLNLALAGLKRLLKKSQFRLSKTMKEIKEEYVQKS